MATTLIIQEDLLVSILNSQTTTLQETLEATQLVATLFTQNAIKKTRPVVDSLFVCLKHNTSLPTVQQNIFQAIGNLTDYQDPSQHWLVSEQDAINVIVDTLTTSPNTPELQAQGFYALQKLVFRNESNIRCLILDCGILKLILSSMVAHGTHVHLQTQACILLRRLSWLASVKEMLMTNACAVVLATMRTFSSEAEIQEHCCAFLHNMSVNTENKAKLALEPYFVHEAILAAMSNHPQNAPVQEEGCAAMCSLALDESNGKLFVRAPYLAHKVILAAMHTHLQIATVQEQGCEALWSLALDDDNKILLVSEPYYVHQAVLNAMRCHPHVANVQVHGCMVFSNLAVHPGNEDVFLQNGAHFTIANALRAHAQHEKVQLEAVWALSNFSFLAYNHNTLKQAEVLELCERAHQAFPNNTQLEDLLLVLEQHLN